MRASTSSLLFLFLSLTTATTTATTPFVPPHIPQASSPQDLLLVLFRRQNSCPAGYNPCSNLGAPNTCCPTSAICSADAAKHVACCPSGASCTGTIGGTATGSGTTAIGPIIIGGSTTAAPTTTTAGGIVFPSSTTSGAAGITAAPGSTVANAFFPFPYIPTTFQDAAVCSSYYSSCQTEFTSCTASLAGGNANGVTVTGGGVGITVQGATATASAASICSSLSQSACFGLQLANCPAFGTGSATGLVVAGSNAIRCCEGVVYGVGVGVAVAVAVGLAGQVLG